MINKTLMGLALLFAGSDVCAQHGTDYLREHFRNAAFATVAGTQYRVETAGAPQGAVMSLKTVDGTLLSTLVLPWHYEGGMTVVGGTVYSGGLRLATTRIGVLAVIAIDTTTTPESLRLASSVDYPGLDPVLLHVDEQETGVFIVDGVGDRLMHGPLAGFPGGVGGFSIIANSTSVSSLADKAVGAYLRLSSDAGNHNGVALAITSWQDAAGGHRVERNSSGWTVQPLGGEKSMWLSSPAAISSASPGAFWVPAHYAASSVELLAPNGSVLSSAPALSGAWNAVPTHSLFSQQPGLPFRLRHVASGVHVNVMPIHRVGSPQGTASVAVEHGRVWPRAELGNLEFGSGVGYSTAVTQQFVVGASMAFRGQNGDPVDANGFLVPEAFVSFTVDPALRGESVGLGLPLPADQGLDGQVLLFQYLFLMPDQSLARSDVFGTTLQWFGGTAAARQASSSPTQSGLATARTLLCQAWERAGNSNREVFKSMMAAASR